MTKLSELLSETYEGVIGFTGSQGIQGNFGYTGSQGNIGYTGSLGFAGSQGIQGNIGYTGSQGIQGIIGYSGSKGDKGEIGYTGSLGIQGVIGYTGSKGFVGSQGIIGFSGSRGNTGFDGSKGDIGFSGSKGDIGYTGSQGYIGSFGYTGSQGIIGYTGSQGVQGITGFSGSKGDQGNIGYTGSQGIIGFTGSQGVTGFDGSKGDIGYTGSKGDTGMGFTIAKIYNSVSDLLSDTTPTGIVSGQFAIIETNDAEDPENSRLYLWDGSVYIYISDLSGAQGIQGPQGNIGFTGSQGVTGFDGSRGIQGDIGFTGSIGFSGSQGNIGPTGFTGSKGDQGDIGFTGSIGFSGSQGNIGPTGFTGSKGDQGNIGFTGSQGFGIIGASNMVGYSVTTTLESGFTAPSTSGLHYLISSIHVTNISTTDGWITTEQSLSGGTPIQLANQIPVPAGSSIELLKRFKVMNPSDILNFQANANSVIQVIISYEINNTNSYFRNGLDVTSTVSDIFSSSNTNGSYVESCLIATDSSLDEKVTVSWTDASNNTIAYFSYDLIIPANGSVELFEKPKFIANGNKIRAFSGSDNAIEILISGRNL
jgi:hypothetical protein